MSVATPIGRVSFPDVFEPSQVMGQGANKFRLTLLVEPDAEGLDEFRDLIEKEIQKKWPDGLPKNFHHPELDGDSMDREETRGKVVFRFTAKEDQRPQVLDRNLNAIAKSDNEFYAGCYARVSTSIYGWNFSGKSGVSLALDAVQKVRDGDPLVGRQDPTKVFSKL